LIHGKAKGPPQHYSRMLCKTHFLIHGESAGTLIP
jgi:hypothetical protein